jgi:uncharacterized membrane protein YphA (DoxX/SURF4 family)
MFNIASILILALLAVTFIQSGYDKVMDWSGNVTWLKGHFEKTRLRNLVPLALFHVLILELISGILCVVGIIQLIINNERTYGLYGGVFSCITLIMLLFGQRLAKDYDGARTIVIYFIPAILVVYWLS